MIVKNACLIFLIVFLDHAVMAQDLEGRKNYLIDSLKKDGIDTIITVHNTCYGCFGPYIQLKTRKETKVCSVKDSYVILWKDSSQLYYKAFNYCQELPRKILVKYEWLDYFEQHKDTITSFIHLPNRNSIVLKSDTIRYSMNCKSFEAPNLYTMIDHYGFYEFGAYIGTLHYESGELNEFIFCNSKTRDFAEVKILGSFYYPLAEMSNKIEEDLNNNGKTRFENFKLLDTKPRRQ